MKVNVVVLSLSLLLSLGACVTEGLEEAPTTPVDDGCGFVSDGFLGDCGETPDPDEEAPDPEEVIPEEPEVEECIYPASNSTRPALGSVIPALSWPSAVNGDGSVTPFSLEEFHCDERFAQYETILFVVGAGWCPACPQYAAYVNTVKDVLEAEGTLLVWYEAEDRSYNLSTSQQSHETITRYLGSNGPGIRVGDKDTLPNAGMVRSNRLVQAFPTQFMVRRRDMKIIAASTTSQFGLPIIQVARYPEADWADPGNNTLDTNVGHTCATDVDCDTGTLLPYCFPSRDENNRTTGWFGGYCTGLTCATDAACGEGNICAPLQEGLKGCFQGCDQEAEDTGCRPGYACRSVSGLLGPAGCVPQ